MCVTEQAIVDFSAGVAQSDDITALLLMKMHGNRLRKIHEFPHVQRIGLILRIFAR